MDYRAFLHSEVSDRAMQPASCRHTRQRWLRFFTVRFWIACRLRRRRSLIDK